MDKKSSIDNNESNNATLLLTQADRDKLLRILDIRTQKLLLLYGIWNKQFTNHIKHHFAITCLALGACFTSTGALIVGIILMLCKGH